MPKMSGCSKFTEPTNALAVCSGQYPNTFPLVIPNMIRKNLKASLELSETFVDKSNWLLIARGRTK